MRLLSLVCFCCTALAISCFAAKYEDQPWAQCIYSEGDVYILQGTQTIKTANRLTVDGTFRKFSSPVKRTFHLWQMGKRTNDLGTFIHKASDSRGAVYQFFAADHTLVAMDDAEEQLQNLTLKKSFHAGGAFLNAVGNNQSRFCMVEDLDRRRIKLLDKLTGRSVPVSAATTNFIGDRWHVDLFVSNDGRRLTRAETEYRTKTITISAWDLQNEKVVLEPHKIRVAAEVNEPKIFRCHIGNNAVLLVFADSNVFLRKGIVFVKSFDADTFAVRQSITMDFKGTGVRTFLEGEDHAVLLFNQSKDPFNPSNRWVVNRYDITTGKLIGSEVVAAPAQ